MKSLLSDVNQFALYGEYQEILLYARSNSSENLSSYEILPVDRNKDTSMRGKTIRSAFFDIVDNSFQLDISNGIYPHFRIAIKFPVFALWYVLYVIKPRRKRSTISLSSIIVFSMVLEPFHGF